ncbi:MAG: 5'/3'-nucleotidase SurE [Gemmatimonadetes bacterium]|nr:5'/3'-nucleotidase SurE [Gemmatimonadota bacterium]
MKPLRVLVTNDDGYAATGIKVLAAAARALGEVTIVAPDREQSATSHSLTLHHPLRARPAPDGGWMVDGTPTDCVTLAVNALLPHRPDVVLSGINHGPNMGEDVLYSGTVSAAMEATVLGIPAIAFSYSGDPLANIEAWEGPVRRLLLSILDQGSFPEDTLLSVNLPAIAPDQVRGVRVTSLGRRRYSDSITRALDPSGREYFWIGGGVSQWSGNPDSDFRAVEAAMISVTPLHLDLTNYGLLERIRGWDLKV